MGHFISSPEQNIGKAKSVGEGQRGSDSLAKVRRRRRSVSTGDAKSVSSQLLGLSLFIMLLAFFIVLNAISSYEETKVRPIMQSLGYTFASDMVDPSREDEPSVSEDEAKSIEEGDALERIKALFASQIPGYEAALSHRTGALYVKVPYDDFEAAVMALGQRNALQQEEKNAQFLKGFFLPTLIALMKTDSMGMPYRMDMVLNLSDNPAALQNERPQQIAAMTKRMAAISQKLEAAGLSTKLVSMGMQKGEVGTIELLFRQHVPYSPVDRPAEVP